MVNRWENKSVSLTCDTLLNNIVFEQYIADKFETEEFAIISIGKQFSIINEAYPLLDITKYTYIEYLRKKGIKYREPLIKKKIIIHKRTNETFEVFKYLFYNVFQSDYHYFVYFDATTILPFNFKKNVWRKYGRRYYNSKTAHFWKNHYFNADRQ